MGNQKSAQDKKSLADAAKKTSQEAEFKLKEILGVMDERDTKMSKAKNEKALAMKKKLQAEEKAAMHKAQKEEEINKALPKPPEVSDITKSKIDPNMMMKRQMKEMNRQFPHPAKDKKGADPDLSTASKAVQDGASEKDPRPAPSDSEKVLRQVPK